jgi:hypothetical protein
MVQKGAQAFFVIFFKDLVGHHKLRHPVKPEGAKALAQLAPGREHPAFVKIPDPSPRTPESVVSPAPPIVKFRFVAVIPPLNVNAPASELIRDALPNVTAPP